MKNIKQPSFREIRQAQKVAQRNADAMAIKQGADPATIQIANSAFNTDMFKNAPITRAGKVVIL